MNIPKNVTVHIQPSVFLIAKTEMLNSELLKWADHHDLLDLAAEDETPLNLILKQASNNESNDKSILLAEFAGRFCYRSFDKGRPTAEYIANIIDMGHGSVLEHVNFSFAIAGVSRSLTHELIRHRVGFAVSQESQRYVDAGNIEFVIPPLVVEASKEEPEILNEFVTACCKAVGSYKDMQESLRETIAKSLGHNNFDDLPTKEKTRARKRINEASRGLLPNAAETRLVWTGNIRSLRHVLDLRGSKHADLEIVNLCDALLEAIRPHCETAFFDFCKTEGESILDPKVTIKSDNAKV